MKRKKKLSKKRGVALLVTFGLMMLITVAATSYIDRATMSIRMARHKTLEVQTTSLCDAGIQAVVLSLWRPFKQSQAFVDMGTQLTGATEANPKISQTAMLNGVGRYATGVIGYWQPSGDAFGRIVVIRSIGWIDRNNNGVADSGEPRKTVDVVTEFRLSRSRVFDYTYFINNFGWMEGFSPSNLIVNGDMRSNGDFTFLSGSGTVNGSVVASANDKLVPGAVGLINTTPVKQADASYLSTFNNGSTPYKTRMRQPYDPARHGALGSAQFEQWRDFVFFSEAQLVSGRIFGAAMEDSNGSRAWVNTGGSPTSTMLDPRPTDEVIMPDLRDFGNVSDAADAGGKRYARSKAFIDEKEFFLDGTPNPNHKDAAGAQDEYISGVPNVNYKGAYLDVWDSSLNSGAGGYKRVSSNGVVSGSVLLVGTDARPIRIHGPVAINGDVGIGGTVQGQGTLYTSRNIHILASVRYKNAPDFSGSNMTTMINGSEKKDFLGLAASQSVIMGDTTNFGFYPLNYMSPPFTKPRLDENGNTIPAFNANEVDAWGVKRYQSLLEVDNATKAAYKSLAAGGVNQIDAVLYTNFVGGGNVGTAGGGMTLNGTIISRDEAIVTWSLPIRMNYDVRIREREVTKQPLIDLDLPRSPTILKSSWQDKGFRVD
ncbi:MAG: hypothetical protein ACKVQS_10860 [Fimbriimonadaceae bacterium]